MILAAGLGTRLGELTTRMPKALIPVGGVPMLERVARRLIDAGAERLVINTHRFAEQIEEAVRGREGFGVEVVFSHEEDHPLETGGGLLHAAHLFQADAPLFIHNVDILTDAPLREMYTVHLRNSALATVAVMRRDTSRRLLFDDGRLYGRVDDSRNLRIVAGEPRGVVREFAFGGIHVVSPELLGLMAEQGTFSILDPYLRLAGEGFTIAPYRIDAYRWIDIGKPEQLRLAEAMTKTGF